MMKEIREVDIKTFLSEFDFEWWNKNQFFIFEGTLPRVKSFIPFRRNYYTIAGLISGEIDILINQESFNVTPNSFIFLAPSHILQVKAVSRDPSLKIIFFERSFLTESENDLRLLNNFSLFSPSSKPVVPVAKRDFEYLIPQIDYIKAHTSDEDRPNRSQVARNLIVSFLYELEAVVQAERAESFEKYSKKDSIANQFNLLLQANFCKEHSVKFYAGLLAISPGYLSEVMKKVTGKNAGELIDELLLLEAKVLLKNPGLGIKQIAGMLHFSDQFSFSKYFKKMTGESPLSFRSNCSVL